MFFNYVLFNIYFLIFIIILIFNYYFYKKI